MGHVHGRDSGEDKIAALADVMKSQQVRIEDLTGRMIRLETALAMLLQQSGGSLQLSGKRE